MSTCSICGAPFTQPARGRKRTTCDDNCAMESERRQRRAVYAQMKATPDEKGYNPYIVVQDALPPERGGFSSGARFDRVEIVEMLKNGALTDGVQLMKSNQLFIVRAKGRGLKLERMTE